MMLVICLPCLKFVVFVFRFSGCRVWLLLDFRCFMGVLGLGVSGLMSFLGCLGLTDFMVPWLGAFWIAYAVLGLCGLLFLGYAFSGRCDVGFL